MPPEGLGNQNLLEKSSPTPRRTLSCLVYPAKVPDLHRTFLNQPRQSVITDTSHQAHLTTPRSPDSESRFTRISPHRFSRRIATGPTEL